MTTSVIIPTYNGAHKLPTLLDSLLQQTYRDFELIVVVDGSTDNTIEVLSNYKDKFPDFKIIQQSNQGRAVVRNNGAKAAKGELLVFADDDMLIPEGWVSAHVSFHTTNKNSICVGNLDSPKSEELISTEFTAFKSWLNNRWNSKLKPNSAHILKLQTPYISANNFSLPKLIFNEIGAFDSRLMDCEDYDLAVRALRSSKSIYLNIFCCAIHLDPDNRTFKSYIKRLKQYKAAMDNLRKIKPDIHIYDEPKKVHVKELIFKSLSSSIWIDIVESGRLTFLPKSIRYKIYDILITANVKYGKG